MVALLEAQVLTIRMVKGRMVEKAGKMVEKVENARKTCQKGGNLLKNIRECGNTWLGAREIAVRSNKKQLEFKLNK